MRRNNHQIARLTFEIGISTMDDAFSVQNEAADIQNALLNSLEKAFDKANQDDVTIQVDRLEIDLSDFSFQSLDHEILEAIENKVFEQLMKLNTQQPSKEKIKTTLNSDSPEEVQLRRMSLSETRLDLLLFVLENGHLPWWAQDDEPVSVDALFRECEEETIGILFNHLRKHNQGKVLSKRLFRHLKPKTLKQLLKISQGDGALYLELSDAIIQLPFQTKEAVLYHLFVAKPAKKKASFERSLIDLKEIIQPSKENVSGSKCLKLLNQMMARNENFETVSSKDNSEDEKAVVLENERISSQLKDLSNNPEDNELIKSSKTSAGEELRILAKNSGLVLVQPFLSQFFRELGLIEDKEFISVKAQHEACYALNFLATGAINMPEEHDLIMEKLLCGIELQEVLLPFNPPNEQLKTACHELLTAILSNWKALGSSSNEAIQKTFLQREGQISEVDGGMKIKFEREAFDILLDKLPWGVSMYKLPWNDQMMYVEW